MPPTDIPEDMSLFNTDYNKYPLLEEVEEHVLTTTLHKGDCLYVPVHSWLAFQSESDYS